MCFLFYEKPVKLPYVNCSDRFLHIHLMRTKARIRNFARTQATRKNILISGFSIFDDINMATNVKVGQTGK